MKLSHLGKNQLEIRLDWAVRTLNKLISTGQIIDNTVLSLRLADKFDKISTKNPLPSNYHEPQNRKTNQKTSDNGFFSTPNHFPMQSNDTSLKRQREKDGHDDTHSWEKRRKLADPDAAKINLTIIEIAVAICNLPQKCRAFIFKAVLNPEIKCIDFPDLGIQFTPFSIKNIEALGIILPHTNVDSLAFLEMNFGNEGAKLLSTFKGIKKLMLMECEIGDEGGLALANTDSLTSLDLSCNNISDVTLIALAKNTSFRVLDIGATPNVINENKVMQAFLNNRSLLSLAAVDVFNDPRPLLKSKTLCSLLYTNKDAQCSVNDEQVTEFKKNHTLLDYSNHESENDNDAKISEMAKINKESYNSLMFSIVVIAQGYNDPNSNYRQHDLPKEIIKEILFNLINMSPWHHDEACKNLVEKQLPHDDRFVLKG